jgi:acyl-CoA thioesterase FadM
VYEVSRAKIKEFAIALGDDNPAYAGENPIAPPTFAAVATFENWSQLIDDPELELELKRLIHADQTFEYFRPIQVGDRLEGWTTLEEVKIRGSLEYLFVRIIVRDQHGLEVGTSRSTFIHSRAAATTTPPVEEVAS